MLKAEAIETLLYGCVTWTLGAEHFAKLRMAHQQVLLRVVGFQRRLRTDRTTLSFAKAFKMTPSESIETTIHKRRLCFYGGRGAAKQGAITQSGSVRDDGGWGETEAWWTSVRLGIDA